MIVKEIIDFPFFACCFEANGITYIYLRHSMNDVACNITFVHLCEKFYLCHHVSLHRSIAVTFLRFPKITTMLIIVHLFPKINLSSPSYFFRRQIIFHFVRSYYFAICLILSVKSWIKRVHYIAELE